MRGKSNSMIRGNRAEDRFKEIAVSLTDKLPIIKVLHTDRSIDARGLDFIITLTTDHDEEIHVPVQVKSSDCGARKFQAKYTSVEYHNVIIIIVNDGRTDTEILSELYDALRSVLLDGIRYDLLFAKLEWVSNGSSKPSTKPRFCRKSMYRLRRR